MPISKARTVLRKKYDAAQTGQFRIKLHLEKGQRTYSQADRRLEARFNNRLFILCQFSLNLLFFSLPNLSRRLFSFAETKKKL